jgi:hypothetical protein
MNKWLQKNVENKKRLLAGKRQRKSARKV